MTCKHCGAPISEGAKFCENCGNKIEDTVVEEKVVEETYKEPERVEAEVVEEDRKTSYTTEEKAASEPVNSAADDASGPIGYSIASLVCGILGLLCCCCGYFGLILSAAGIVLGIVSLNKNCEGKGMAIAGIVCGGVGAAFIVIGLAVSAATGNFGLDKLDGLDSLDDLTDFLESL